MYQRKLLCPVSAIGRSINQDVPTLSRTCSRQLHNSIRRLEDGPPAKSPPNLAPSEPRVTRQMRSVDSFRKISAMQNVTYDQNKRRPLPANATLAAGIFPSGQKVDTRIRRTPAPAQRSTDSAASGDGRQPQSRPPGTMVRAPAQLRVTRNANGPRTPGPALTGRGRDSGGPRKPTGSRGDGGPKRRDKKTVQQQDDGDGVTSIEDTLSDGMVQHLMRLQKLEWDRKPYEPTYAHGSAAALELIEAGKKLFEGEKPTKKVWGKLEHRIGIVGMHGVHGP